MTDWTAFAGITAVVIALFLALARLSYDPASGVPPSGTDAAPGTGAARDPDDGAAPGRGRDVLDPDAPTGRATEPPSSGEALRRSAGAARVDLPPGALLLNVVLSQGLFATLLVSGAWWTRVPPAALGLAPAFSPRLLAVGVAFGAALWVANEFAGRVARGVGVEVGEELRAALAPDSVRGWAVLLFAVLPLVALFEEFLFRAALVGALSAGFPLSPWLLAAVSSVAFALGHGAQGRLGILVTGVLGFVLAAGFVSTGSLLVVVVAHYVVNVLEFVVHERPDVGG